MTLNYKLGAIMVASALLLGCLLIGWNEREPKRLEVAYEFLAPALRMPEVCDKISSKAYSMAGMDRTIEYSRSKCYLNLALQTGDVAYCAKVRRRWTLFMHSASADDCRARLRRGESFQEVGIDPELVLRTMGYEDAHLIVPGRYYKASWLDLYHDLLQSGALRKRVQRLPAF